MNLMAGACRELATGLAEVLYLPSLHSGGTGMAPAPRVMATLRCARPRAAHISLAVHDPNTAELIHDSESSNVKIENSALFHHSRLAAHAICLISLSQGK